MLSNCKWRGFNSFQRFSKVAFLSTAVSLLNPFALATQARDWNMGRADAKGTGFSPDSLPKKLRQIWKVEIEGLGFDAGPIIADGKVFANDHDGRIVVLDLETGKEVWRKRFYSDAEEEVETGFVATPSFSNGILYAADFDGVLHALDAANGDEKWKFSSQNQITGSPVFFKDSVIFTSEDGNLYRLDKKTGKEVWVYKTEQPILCGAALAEKVTFLGGCDEQLHVVDLATGTRVGEPVKIGPTQSTPNVVGNNVIIPTQAGSVFSFGVDEQELKEHWVFYDAKLSDEFRTSLAVAKDLIIATGRNKRVFAVDVESGEVKWVKILRKKAEASPIIAGDSVIVAAADGRILRFDLKTGDDEIIDEVKGTFLGSPATADGKLVLTNDRGDIFCYGE